MATYYTPPKLTLPPLPAAPTGNFGQGGRPNLAAEADLQRQIDALPSLYAPSRQLSKQSLAEGLKQYGDMFVFAQDNPNTPEDESLGVEANQNARPGPLLAEAYRNVRGQHAAAGTLYSSYTDRDIGGVAARISAQARDMVNKYAAAINESSVNEMNDSNSRYADLTRLYGPDSQWLADQVPPPPAPAPPAPTNKFRDFAPTRPYHPLLRSRAR